MLAGDDGLLMGISELMLTGVDGLLLEVDVGGPLSSVSECMLAGDDGLLIGVSELMLTGVDGLLFSVEILQLLQTLVVLTLLG